MDPKGWKELMYLAYSPEAFQTSKLKPQRIV
jgi:hypothetical protein